MDLLNHLSYHLQNIYDILFLPLIIYLILNLNIILKYITIMNKKWTKEKLKETIKVLKNNELYNIGEQILTSKNENSTSVIYNPILHKNSLIIADIHRYHADSLLSTYYKLWVKNKREPDFYNILLDRKNKLNIKSYDNDTVLLHLRTGDDIYNRGLGNQDNMSYFINKINELPSNKKCIIVTAMHYGASSEHYFESIKHKIKESENNGYNFFKNNKFVKSNYETNINLIYELIQRINKPIEILSNTNIDIDLIHLSFCKHLITSKNTGQFSQLVSLINNKFNTKEKKKIENIIDME